MEEQYNYLTSQEILLVFLFAKKKRKKKKITCTKATFFTVFIFAIISMHGCKKNIFCSEEEYPVAINKLE